MKKIIQQGREAIERISIPWIGRSFRLKVLAAFLGLSLIPLGIVGVISFNAASNALIDRAAAELEAVRAAKADRIESWFQERRKDILILSENPSAIDAMLELEEGFEKLGSRAPEYLRQQYLGRSDLRNSGDGSEYSKAHAEVDGLFGEALEYYGYEELYLVTLEGDVVYSTKKTDEFATNLFRGPYKESNLAEAFRVALESGDDDFVTIQDYAFFAPANAPAAFVASPMFSEYFEQEAEMQDKGNRKPAQPHPQAKRDADDDDDDDDDDDAEKAGRIVGIMIYELPIDTLSKIMQERTGLGRSGETYLVGSDKLWRTDSHYSQALGVEHTILNTKTPVNTDAVRSALAGQGGTHQTRNYLGTPVLSSWTPLTINKPSEQDKRGTTWALIAEISLEEVREPVNRLAWLTTMIVIVVTAVVTLVAFLLSGGVSRQVRIITEMFGEIGMGNFGARAKVVSQDELGKMAESLNAMLDNTLTLIQSREERDAIQGSIMKLLNEISTLTEGDLTTRAEVTEDVTGAIADAFNDMTIKLGRIVRNVKSATEQVGQTAKKVTATTEMLAETSRNQSKEVTKAIEVIDEMTNSVRQVAKRAVQSALVSQQSIQNSKEGASIVQKTNHAMSLIRERVQETARAIKRLGESSQEIGNIVQIIDEIADRTSILALNASIQAAMAGDAGRGFAVVAEEVQRLAERSTDSTKQIEKLVKNIQGDINDAGKSMEESIQQVVEGTLLADNAHKKLEEIEKVSSQLAGLVKFINELTKQQAQASETVSKIMEKVGQVSTQNSQSSRDTAVAMTEMSDTADQLRKSVEEFKLEQPDSRDRQRAA